MALERLRMDGKVAIVHGAGGGGIGTATSLALAEAGAKVVAVDIVPDHVKDTEQRIAKMGGTCLGIVADVRKSQELQRIVDTTTRELGAIHCLANVAGGLPPGVLPLKDYSEEAFDAVLNLNLRYVFLACQKVARVMIDRRIPGSMVNIASSAAHTAAPYLAPYGAAKAGLTALTRSMAIEWA